MNDGFIKNSVTAGVGKADTSAAGNVHIGGEGRLNVLLAQDTGNDILVTSNLGVAQDQECVTLGVEVLCEQCPVGAILEVSHINIQFRALHIQQNTANATAFRICPAIGVAFHQNGGLGLQNGVTAQDQVADGAFAGGQVAVIVSGPNRCEVAVLIAHSID